MERVYFITHPEVEINPEIDVIKWDLSEKGKQRLTVLLNSPWISTIKSVYSSNEVKAITAAEVIARRLNLRVNAREGLGEINRDSTGFIGGEEFERVVEEFFKNPELSARGWEIAESAQERIVNAVSQVLVDAPEGNVAIVSHGAVGALLLGYLQGNEINRDDLATGQGFYFVFDRENKKIENGWIPIDSSTASGS